MGIYVWRKKTAELCTTNPFTFLSVWASVLTMPRIFKWSPRLQVPGYYSLNNSSFKWLAALDEIHHTALVCNLRDLWAYLEATCHHYPIWCSKGLWTHLCEINLVELPTWFADRSSLSEMELFRRRTFVSLLQICWCRDINYINLC